MSEANKEVIENYRCRVIAETMVQVTKDVIWNHIKTWAYERKPGMEFQARVGKGKATNLKYSPGNPLFVITYGIEMVRAKHRPSSACLWTSGREVLDRNYYDGRLSLLNALAHTCIHEAGHLVQVLLDRVYDGSVHNEEFYEILDRMHSNPVASMVRHELNLRTRQKDIVISHLPLITRAELDAKDNVKVGDKVSTIYNGMDYKGIVSKVNRKTISVNGIEESEGQNIKGHKHGFNLISNIETDYDPLE